MKEDITKYFGKKYGRLRIIKEVEPHINPNGKKKRKVLCKCDCGISKPIDFKHLINYRIKSCGCYRKEQMEKSKIATTHNMSKTRIWGIWRNIRIRCYDKNGINYKNYGGRGITVCKRWHTFENFRDDMYKSYSKHCKEYGIRETTIDRVDNDGNYEPDNCRWATRKEQANNKRSNRNITFNGKTQTLKNWARETGLGRTVISSRIKRGWKLTDAFTIPITR